MSELKIVDSTFQFISTFIYLLLFLKLGLGISMTSPVIVIQQYHGHTITQSYVIVEGSERIILYSMLYIY